MMYIETIEKSSIVQIRKTNHDALYVKQIASYLGITPEFLSAVRKVK